MRVGVALSVAFAAAFAGALWALSALPSHSEPDCLGAHERATLGAAFDVRQGPALLWDVTVVCDVRRPTAPDPAGDDPLWPTP